MNYQFHEADDSCAPFPHRVLIKPARTVIIKGRLKNREIIYPRQVFVICAECDHWIVTKIPCECSQRCHELQEILASLIDSVTGGSVE
jgi:hypothetical protein